VAFKTFFAQQKKKTDKNIGKKEYYGNHVSKDTQNILCPTKKKQIKIWAKKNTTDTMCTRTPLGVNIINLKHQSLA
jgi:hypothetical protein